MRRTRTAAAAAVSIVADNAVAPRPQSRLHTVFARATAYLHGDLADIDVMDAPRGTYLAAVPRDLRCIIAGMFVRRRDIRYLHQIVTAPDGELPPKSYNNPEMMREYGARIGLDSEILRDTDYAQFMQVGDYVLTQINAIVHVTRSGKYIGYNIGVRLWTAHYLGMSIMCYYSDRAQWLCFDLDAPEETFTIPELDARYISLLPCGLALCHSNSRLLNARTRCSLHVPELREIGDVVYRNLYVDDYGDWFAEQNVNALGRIYYSSP